MGIIRHQDRPCCTREAQTVQEWHFCSEVGKVVEEAVEDKASLEKSPKEVGWMQVATTT